MLGCRTFFKCDGTRLVVIAHAATCQPNRKNSVGNCQRGPIFPRNQKKERVTNVPQERLLVLKPVVPVRETR